MTTFSVTKWRGRYCVQFGDDEQTVLVRPYRMTRFQAKKLAKRLNK